MSWRYSNTVNALEFGGQGQEVACDITKIYATILILEVQIQVYIWHQYLNHVSSNVGSVISSGSRLGGAMEALLM